MIPLLQNGDRLTREEFERRFDAMLPHLKKAELINGVVYLVAMEWGLGNRGIHLPVTASHGQAHLVLGGLLGMYYATSPGTGGGISGSIRFPSPNSMPQPDVYLLISSECGGQSTLADDDYIEGAPELIAEITASSVSFDLHDKLELYQRDGVREYIVWRIEDKAIDWFVLHRGKYRPLAPGPDRITRSKQFPGLWLDRSALLRHNHQKALKALQEGLASSEHAAFVAQLQRKQDRKRR